MIKDKEYWKKRVSELNKERYHSLKKRGICVECGFRKAIPGIARCEFCRESLKQRQYNYRLKHIEEGVCANCGGEKIDKSLTYCEKCRAQSKEYVKRKKLEKRGK